MSIKTKEIQGILEPLERQINKIAQILANDSIDTNNVSSVTSVLFNLLHCIRDKCDTLSKENISDYREMKSKITSMVEEFCSLDYIKESMEKPDKQYPEDVLCTTVLDKFKYTLEMLEKLECLPLKQRLVDCLDYIKEMGLANEIEHSQNIKELGTSILELLVPLQRYRKSLASQLLSERIILYTCQLCTAFKLLVQLVQEQHQLNASIYNCKKYVCERLCFCLKMIIEVLDASNPSAEDEQSDRENHFVYRMDLALDIISEMTNKTQEEQASECEELWVRIEDVFSHAMAIAQVCKPYNFKAITGACQSIVSEYENLKLQLTSESSDPSLNNLFMNTLNDALYRLERKINVAVLHLVMEVFSDPYNALKKLVMTCGNSLSAKNRSQSDLVHAIEDFDQIIDKSVQIGLFAIASCRNTTRNSQIRNSLAGLESLETELVSAITAFYLHPDSKEMRANVKILTAQWQSEMNLLHDAVDLIMDSAAYCEVVLDDLQERISIMSDCLDNREPVTQLQVQSVVQRSLTLSRQVTAIMNDIGNDMIERQTTMMVRELKAAIFEADAASKCLLTENATEPQQLRVIKRCELILNVVKRLQPALVTIMNNTSLMSTNYSKSSKGQGDTVHDTIIRFSSTVYGSSHVDKPLTYIRTPYTVRNCKSPLSIQPANSVPRTQVDLSCLIPYIKRGREMRTERSIMYKTPQRAEFVDQSLSESTLRARSLSSVRQHLFSRDRTEFRNDTCLPEESIDLTDILEKFMSCCTTSNTLSLSISHREKSQSAIDPKSKKSERSLPDEKIGESSTIGGGDGPPLIDSSKSYDDPQRFNRNDDSAPVQLLHK